MEKERREILFIDIIIYLNVKVTNIFPVILNCIVYNVNEAIPGRNSMAQMMETLCVIYMLYIIP